MQSKRIKVVFKNQIIYVGIDVHKENWSVTFRSNHLLLRTISMDPNPEVLAKYLKANYPGAKYMSVYEAGFCGYWIHRALINYGIDNIIINSASIPTTGQEKTRKTDQIDSAKLARELEDNKLHPIYVPTEYYETLRSLTRLRKQYVSDRVRQKNRIKSFLDFKGKKIPSNYEISNWSGNFISYLRKLSFTNIEDKIILDSMLDTLDQIKKRIAKVVVLIRKYINSVPERKQTLTFLTSVPGIGFLTGATLMAELVDISRFKHLNHLASYVGLVPSVYCSGETKRNLGITNI